MAVFRAVLYIKALAIVAGLIVALLQQDRPAQAAFVWPLSLVLLMLVLFGTSWFEKIAGGLLFPLGLAMAVVLQSIELSVPAPLPYTTAGTASLTAAAPAAGYQPVEPFFFLLVPVVLLAWTYGWAGLLAAVSTAAVLHGGLTLAWGGPPGFELVAILTRIVVLSGAGGVAVLLAASRHSANRLDRILESDMMEAAHMLAQDSQTEFHSAGLIDALYQVADKFKQRTGVQVDLTLHLDPDSLAPEQAATAMEIVEQALDSVAGQPGEQASVSLLCSGSHVALSVHGARLAADTPEHARRANDARMFALRQRAESVGGIFCVSHQAQHGTTVACVFPRSPEG